VGLELVLNTFARFPDEHPALTAALYDRRDDTLAFYEAVMAMIAAGDPDAARDTVRRALEAIDAAWVARNAPRGASKESAPKEGATRAASAKKGRKAKRPRSRA
jgi:hypothetical protein